MGEIETSNVHSVEDQLLEHVNAGASRSDGTDDTGLTDQMWGFANVETTQVLHVRRSRHGDQLLLLPETENCDE